MNQIFTMPKIAIDEEGVWRHDGEVVTHERTIEDLFRRVYFKDGEYFVTGEKIPVPVEVVDVAFFIRGLKNNGSGIVLMLSNGIEERLDFSTLEIDKKNRLYAKIQNGSVRARFERKVYHEFIKDLTERDGYYGLLANGLFYPLKPVKEPEPDKIEQKPVQPQRPRGGVAVIHPVDWPKKKVSASAAAAKKSSKDEKPKVPEKSSAKKTGAKSAVVKKKAAKTKASGGKKPVTKVVKKIQKTKNKKAAVVKKIKPVVKKPAKAKVVKKLKAKLKPKSKVVKIVKKKTKKK